MEGVFDCFTQHNTVLIKSIGAVVIGHPCLLHITLNMLLVALLGGMQFQYLMTSSSCSFGVQMYLLWVCLLKSVCQMKCNLM